MKVGISIARRFFPVISAASVARASAMSSAVARITRGIAPLVARKPMSGFVARFPVRLAVHTLALCMGVLLAGCGDIPVSYEEPTSTKKERKNNFGKFFGEDALSFGGKAKAGTETGLIGVNSFLWHAVLDTLSYMPLISADPFGGVVITDWYSPEENGDERLKIDVVILSRQLRSDGLRVSVFRQVKGPALGQWESAPVDPTVAQELEEIILHRARQLKIENI